MAKQYTDLPILGRGAHDYQSLNEVLKELKTRTSLVGSFAFDDTRRLRSRGHDRTAHKYHVPEVVRRAKREVKPWKWLSAISFANLLLPCVTAEISPTQETGITRLCLPFIHDDSVDVEKAITSICSVAWVLGQKLGIFERTETQIARALHKMKIEEESGEMWFNKSCRSGRIATTIIRHGNFLVYMYLGGGAVGDEQSQILSGIVVNCKSWRWAHLVCCAARLLAMAKMNFLNNIHRDLLMASDEGELVQPSKDAFMDAYEALWEKMLQTLNIDTNMAKQLQAQRVSDALSRTREEEEELTRPQQEGNAQPTM